MTGASIEVSPVGVVSRVGVSVIAAVAGSRPDDLRELFGAADAALADEGLSRSDVVRIRLLAAARPTRDAGSAERFRLYAGSARCATSSYIDEERFPGGDGVRIEVLALRGAGADKVAVEYDPPEPPCRLVASGELVFLSGLTSTEPELADQIRHIADRLRENLAVGAATVAAPVRPLAATVYVHRSVGLDELVDLAERLDLGPVELSFARCDGFSKPGKLLEVEVDAIARP